MRYARRGAGESFFRGHPTDFFDRGATGSHVCESRLPERPHSSGPSSFRDPLDSVAVRHARLEVRRAGQDLSDGQAPAIARAPADSTCRLTGGIRGFVRRRTVDAELSNETLGDDALHRRRDLVRRDPDVDEPCDGACCVIRMEGRQHQVTRERRLNRDLGGLPVANLANQHDVRILTHD